MKQKLNKNPFKSEFRKKLKNVKTFESFVNESANNFYRGDLNELKAFYDKNIKGHSQAQGIVDALVNDEEGSDEDMVQYFIDEFGMDEGKAKEIVAGRDLFIGQLFDLTESLTESTGERQCFIEIVSEFDSGFAEWIVDSKVLDHLGQVTISQSGNNEIVQIKCSSLHLSEVIEAANSNTVDNLDGYVQKITITYQK